MTEPEKYRELFRFCGMLIHENLLRFNDEQLVALLQRLGPPAEPPRGNQKFRKGEATTIRCHRCLGSGVTVLSSAYDSTLQMLREHGRSTGASLARVASQRRGGSWRGGSPPKATAMNNRLRRLEQLGLATSEWDGRERWYEVKS